MGSGTSSAGMRFVATRILTAPPTRFIRDAPRPLDRDQIVDIADAEAGMKAAVNEALYAPAAEPRPFVPGVCIFGVLEAVRGPDGVWHVEIDG